MIELLEAVKEKKVISFVYNSTIREAEVHAVGISNSNPDEILVRAYERYDEFKLFKYSKMEDIKLLDKTFFIRTRYNRHEDKAMAQIMFSV